MVVVILLLPQNLCEKLQQEKQTTEARVDELKKRVSELMERVQALRERERLLVAFPELNNWTLAQPQSRHSYCPTLKFLLINLFSDFFFLNFH